MTERPSLVCPRCGSSDVRAVQVGEDAATTVCCGDPNCTQAPWSVPAPRPADVQVLVMLGQELAGYLAASHVPLMGDLDSKRALHGVTRTSLAITDLLREGVAA